MSLLFEVIAQVIFEILLYGTGREFTMVLLPHLGIEDPKHPESTQQRRWWSMTYVRNGRTFLYSESVQGIGLVCWIVIGLMCFVVIKYAI